MSVTESEVRAMINASLAQVRQEMFGLSREDRRALFMAAKERNEQFQENDEPEEPEPENEISPSTWSENAQNYFCVRVRKFMNRSNITDFDEGSQKFMASDEWDPDSIEAIGENFTSERIMQSDQVNFSEFEQANQDIAVKIERFQLEHKIENFGSAATKYFELHPRESGQYLGSISF